MQRCLRDRGWQDATVTPDNGISISLPLEQRSQFESDTAACRAEVGYADRTGPLTRQEAEAVFDAYLAAADCVRGLGYPVADPPSREAGIEALMQPIIDLGWDPYEAVIRKGQDEYYRVLAGCPQPMDVLQ